MTVEEIARGLSTTQRRALFLALKREQDYRSRQSKYTVMGHNFCRAPIITTFEVAENTLRSLWDRGLLNACVTRTSIYTSHSPVIPKIVGRITTLGIQVCKYLGG
jgi:hypothetical protein